MPDGSPRFLDGDGEIAANPSARQMTLFQTLIADKCTLFLTPFPRRFLVGRRVGKFCPFLAAITEYKGPIEITDGPP